MYQPKISIITICFNSEKYLERTIQSVLSQSYKNIEYILVDGGSIDGTIELIRRYQKQISRWTSEPDQGIADAYNKGIHMSSGEIIGLINSDDWYEPTALETAVSFFQTYPDADVIHGDLQYWENGKKEMYLKPAEVSKLQVDMILNHATCFVKRESYQRWGFFDKNYKYALDYELFLRFYKQNAQFIYSKKLMAHMSLGGKSDRNWNQAYYEILNAKLTHLNSTYFSYLVYMFQICRSGIRRLLQVLRLQSIVILWRSMQGRKRYFNEV